GTATHHSTHSSFESCCTAGDLHEGRTADARQDREICVRQNSAAYRQDTAGSKENKRQEENIRGESVDTQTEDRAMLPVCCVFADQGCLSVSLVFSVSGDVRRDREGATEVTAHRYTAHPRPG